MLEPLKCVCAAEMTAFVDVPVEPRGKVANKEEVVALEEEEEGEGPSLAR